MGFTCALCGAVSLVVGDHGHNPTPLAAATEKCCDVCNRDVIAARASVASRPYAENVIWEREVLEFVCALCGVTSDGYGHNPAPLVAATEKCCDGCLWSVVDVLMKSPVVELVESDDDELVGWVYLNDE